jgi:C4-dicarboxylate-specific signal transduction histidine kinase
MMKFNRRRRVPSVEVDRASHVATVAELSASIAHEVSHPLTTVLTSSNTCERWLTADPPNIERALMAVERITRAANTARDVVNHIRVLSRRPEEAREPVALEDLVAEARDLMAEEASRYFVHMNVDAEPDLPSISVDRVQIRQGLINLIRNGLEAMEFVARDRTLKVTVRRCEDMIEIAISDCGVGLEYPDKIFQPYFTTKFQGMGMGLAICRSIADAHAGRLFAKQNDSHGTTFIFALPIGLSAQNASAA